MTNKNILIIGGGYGGISAAKILGKRYAKQSAVNITLVDKRPFHSLMTELHEAASGRVEPDSVRIPYSKIFGASKVNVVLDNIKGVDFKNKRAFSSAKTYGYDYLVLGSGAESEYFGLSGVKEHSFSLWSFEDALKLREHINGVFERALAEQNIEKRRAMLSFVIAGGGFTGIELAGELFEWRDAMCKKWLLCKSEVRITVIEAQDRILPMLEDDLHEKAVSYLRKNGVEILCGTAISGAEAGLVKLKSGYAIATETFIWTAGISGSAFADSLDIAKGPFGKNSGSAAEAQAAEAGGAARRNKKGRLLVTDEMRSVEDHSVFAVGDNLWFCENDKPIPQVVESALFSAQTAARNIIADIEGRSPRKFKSEYHGFMVSLGSRYAVSNALGIKLSGSLSMALKHIVNLHYLIGVAGINQCWEYIKHEFLDMRGGRSVLGGFVSHKTRFYWILPLRLWLGLMWVFEGINKIGEGWFDWKGGSKTGWMFSKGVIQAGTADAASAASDAVDTLSAASGAAADTAADAAGAAAGAVDTTSAVSDAVEQAADTLSAASAVVEQAAEAAEAAGPVWDTAQPVFDSQGGIVSFFRTAFMDGIVSAVPFQFLQGSIVIIEILIGLALFGGLFTWWAALFSIVFCIVFSLSGIFRWDQLWFVFAAFLCLGGAGRAFGLDYWVVPFFKKIWNGLKAVRRRYLYFDNPSK